MTGYYTADGTDKLLTVPIDATSLRIINMTNTDAQTATELVEAYWQEGMDYGIGYKLDDDQVWQSDALDADTGITKFNSGDNPVGTAENYTAFTNAAPPVVQVANADAYPAGSIVRMQSNTGCTQLDGMDFTVAANDATHIDLTYMTAPGSASTGGTLYPVLYDKLWYPRSRFISNITKAASAVITMTVTHDYAVGDAVRIMCPPEFGMKEINLAQATVTAISAANNTITVDVDTRTYTAFTFPATGTKIPFHAEVLPISGPVQNAQVRGFKIKTGAAAAGGSNNDVIYWIAESNDTF